jgi:hypothetical protein
MLTLSGTGWSWPSQMSEEEVAIERKNFPAWVRVTDIRRIDIPGATVPVSGPVGYTPFWYEHPYTLGGAVGLVAGVFLGSVITSLFARRRRS